jgi:Sulfotransferase domain
MTLSISSRRPEPEQVGTSRAQDPDVAVGSLQRDSTSAVTDVAYIGGSGRSGSTVIALLLGQLPGFVAAGGLSNLWERGLKENYLCGCGEPFRQCPFWERVGREAFGGWDALDADELVRLKFAVTKYRHAPWHLVPGLRPGFSDQLLAYSDHMARLYAAIKSVSGRRVVVDSSHDVVPALLLRGMPRVRGRILHLVRDSRGVAYSLSKRVLRAEATTAPTYMSRYAPARAGLEWVVANLPYHLIRMRPLPRLRIRYESVVASPAIEIPPIVEFFGGTLSTAELSILQGDSIEITENHMVSGNPHRLGTSQVQVRLDDEWRRRMTSKDRMIVTLLTWPLGVAYGYMGIRRGGRPGAANGNQR